MKAEIQRPDVVGALLGKAAAVVKIASQSSANRAKHLRDFDSLARLLGALDRNGANLTKSERRMIVSLSGEPGLSELALASLAILVRSGTE